MKTQNTQAPLWGAVAPALVGLSMLLSPAAEARIKTVTVTGEAAVVEGDRVQTEKNAKRSARRKAMEEGAGVLVKSNTIVRNFQMVSDEIVTSAKGVLTDENWGPVQIEGNVAKVQLTAKVSPEAIEDAICTVVKANSDPKVALVFVEKSGDDSGPWRAKDAQRGLVEALFTEAMMNNCFTIVEPGVKVTEVSANGDLPQETIEQIIKNTDAQYILLGQGRIVRAVGANRPSIFPENMKSYAIAASVRLLNTQTNVVEAIASSSVNVFGVSPEHAFKVHQSKITDANGESRMVKSRYLVVDGVMDKIFDQIITRWNNDLVNAAKVMVVVKGANKYKHAKAFQRGVESSIGGAKVTKLRVSGGKAMAEIELDGGADRLASEIEGKTFGKKKVEVLEVVKGKVVLELVD